MPADLKVVVVNSESDIQRAKEDMWRRPVDCPKCGHVRRVTIAEQIASPSCPCCLS